MYRTTEPRIAAIQLLTLNPGTMAAHILMTIPFTTKVKSPKVRILIGRVKNMRMGQIKAFATPTTMAAISAEIRPLTSKPGMTKAVVKKANAERNQRSKCILIESEHKQSSLKLKAASYVKISLRVILSS